MITRRQCKAARSGLGWTRDELSERASVGKRTIIDFENGKREPMRATNAAIEAALRGAGATFDDGMVCVPVD